MPASRRRLSMSSASSALSSTNRMRRFTQPPPAGGRTPSREHTPGEPRASRVAPPGLAGQERLRLLHPATDGDALRALVFALDAGGALLRALLFFEPCLEVALTRHVAEHVGVVVEHEDVGDCDALRARHAVPAGRARDGAELAVEVAHTRDQRELIVRAQARPRTPRILQIPLDVPHRAHTAEHDAARRGGSG